MSSNEVIALKERLYKDQIDGTTFFRKLISDRLGEDAYVLDLGCGKGKGTFDFRSEAAFVVGCDIGKDVNENRFVSARVCADANVLPFRSESFHLVLMDFVVEHLKSPDLCAREIFRVLRHRGYLTFRTPNLHHYVSIIGRMTPHWFHRLVANRVRGLTRPSESDVFKTYYRANTSGIVNRVFSNAGFYPDQIIMVEREPSYLMFSRPTFLLGYWYERLVNKYKRLANFRSNIFAIMRKP